MAYVRWVCTTCGAVAVTEGRRPEPHGGTWDCEMYRGKYNFNSRPHRWVKDGGATDEEFLDYQHKLAERNKGCAIAFICPIIGLLYCVYAYVLEPYAASM